jgi:hypothetical protein
MVSTSVSVSGGEGSKEAAYSFSAALSVTMLELWLSNTNQRAKQAIRPQKEWPLTAELEQ